MKYIKKFEEANNIIYNIGDYVRCIDDKGASQTLIHNNIYIVKDIKDFGEILQIINIKVEGYSNWFSDVRFIHATPQEIKKHKFEQNMNKYNL